MQGSLEVCLLGLEAADASGDAGALAELVLPICAAVAEFYAERFPHTNSRWPFPTHTRPPARPGAAVLRCCGAAPPALTAAPARPAWADHRPFLPAVAAPARPTSSPGR